MLTTNLLELFISQQSELIKQADHYRLVKPLEKPNRQLTRFYAIIGRMLISSGQQLISRT